MQEQGSHASTAENISLTIAGVLRAVLVTRPQENCTGASETTAEF